MNLTAILSLLVGLSIIGSVFYVVEGILGVGLFFVIVAFASIITNYMLPPPEKKIG